MAVFLPAHSYTNSKSVERLTHPIPILRSKIVYALRCAREGSDYSSYKESIHKHILLPIMLRAQIFLAHIYYPINICPPLAAWLIAVCNPDFEYHMHCTLMRAKFKLPSSPEVPCYGIFAWRSLESLRQCVLQLLFCFSLEKWYRTRRVDDHFFALVSSVLSGIKGTGKTIFNMLRALFIELWKCIGFPQLKKHKNYRTLRHWTLNQSSMASLKKIQYGKKTGQSSAFPKLHLDFLGGRGRWDTWKCRLA